MKEEIWKDIVGYEELYEVSNLGRIKSLNIKTGKEKIRKLSKNQNGYLFVGLTKNRITKTVRINRAVAEAFIPNPNNFPEVNHKDENKENNCVENLEWCTRKYNMNYGNIKDKMSKKIFQYTIDGELIKEWPSITDTEKFGYAITNISECCNRKRMTHKNYIWSFNKLTLAQIKRILDKYTHIYQYDLDGNFIKEWLNGAECIKAGFHHPNIKGCCNGKRKTHKGYRWSHQKIEHL